MSLFIVYVLGFIDAKTEDDNDEQRQCSCTLSLSEETLRNYFEQSYMYLYIQNLKVFFM